MIRSTLGKALLFCLAICLIAPCGLAAPATTITTSRLQGTVFSGASNEPTPGAKVRLYGDTGVLSTVTDRDGNFCFTDVAQPGVYSIQANYRDQHAEQNVMVPAGAVVQVSLQLDTPDPNISAKP